MNAWIRGAVLGMLAAAVLTVLLTWSCGLAAGEISLPEDRTEGQNTEKGRAERGEVGIEIAGEEETAAEKGMKEETEAETGKDVRVAALTFDDGPHALWTPLLLDGLKERGVKATFFVMGQNIPGNEELIKRMVREGHLVGNHSYRHEPLTKEGMDQVCVSFDRTGEMIREITGIRPEYARPPYGDWNEELECRTELSTVLWDVDSLDWSYQNRQKIADKVCREIENGDIVLMHDIFQSSQEAALDIIDRLSAEGWTFVTVDELMVD